jgi:hypothetical protein
MEKEHYPEVDVGDLVDKAEMGPVHKKMYEVEMGILGPDEEGCNPVETDTPENYKSWLVSEIKTSDCALVVFDKEGDRDNALDPEVQKKLETMTYKIAGESFTGNLKLIAVNCEPTTVNWQNYHDTSLCGMFKGFCKGIFGIYLPCLAVWFFCFYVPYAYSLYNFNYDNGAELPTYYGLLFTIIVVGGNATMYLACDLVVIRLDSNTKTANRWHI